MRTCNVIGVFQLIHLLSQLNSYLLLVKLPVVHAVVLLYLVLVDSINKLFVSAGNCLLRFIFTFNHNYNKILKSDWLSTALISALIGQLNRTVRVMPK